MKEYVSKNTALDDFNEIDTSENTIICDDQTMFVNLNNIVSIGGADYGNGWSISFDNGLRISIGDDGRYYEEE